MTEPVWAGRFDARPDQTAMAFTRSLPVDRRLIGQDLAATRAHVDALARAGLLDTDERKAQRTNLSTSAVRCGIASATACARANAKITASSASNGRL